VESFNKLHYKNIRLAWKLQGNCDIQSVVVKYNVYREIMNSSISVFHQFAYLVKFKTIFMGIWI
jgi:hypothetical protein